MSALIVAFPASAAVIPLDDPFQINSDGSHFDISGLVAVDDGFIVTWKVWSGHQSGADRAQRYDTEAQRVGGEFSLIDRGAEIRALTNAGDDDFVVIFYDSSLGAIFGRRYYLGGQTLNYAEFLVSGPVSENYNYAVYLDRQERLVVSWAPSFGEIVGRYFGMWGAPITPVFPIDLGCNTATTLWNSELVVVCAKDEGLFGQRYDQNGNPIGDVFKIAAGHEQGEAVESPGIADAFDGTFLVVWAPAVWSGPDTFTAPVAIQGRLFHLDGTSATSEFQISPGVSYQYGAPQVIIMPNDIFVVIWVAADPDFNRERIFGHLIDADGNLLGEQFAVTPAWSFDQWSARLMPLSETDFVVVWGVWDVNDAKKLFGRRFRIVAEDGPPPSATAADGTAIPTAAATSTPHPSCTGDCDGDGLVRVDEVVRGVDMALHGQGLNDCRQFDDTGNGVVEVDELITAVSHVLLGCPQP